MGRTRKLRMNGDHNQMMPINYTMTHTKSISILHCKNERKMSFEERLAHMRFESFAPQIKQDFLDIFRRGSPDRCLITPLIMGVMGLNQIPRQLDKGVEYLMAPFFFSSYNETSKVTNNEVGGTRMKNVYFRYSAEIPFIAGGILVGNGLAKSTRLHRTALGEGERECVRQSVDCAIRLPIIIGYNQTTFEKRVILKKMMRDWAVSVQFGVASRQTLDRNYGRSEAPIMDLFTSAPLHLGETGGSLENHYKKATLARTALINDHSRPTFSHERIPRTLDAHPYWKPCYVCKAPLTKKRSPPSLQELAGLRVHAFMQHTALETEPSGETMKRLHQYVPLWMLGWIQNLRYGEPTATIVRSHKPGSDLHTN